MDVQWRRNTLLALACAALFCVDVPYHARFFGVDVSASLVHLHAGFLFAVAVLYRQRSVLITCAVAALAAWALKAHLNGQLTAVSIGYGVIATTIMVAGLLVAARWLLPAGPATWTFAVADMPRFVLVGMILYPLLMAALNLVPSSAARDAPLANLLASRVSQIWVAKFFGVLVIAFPMIVLGTHRRLAVPALWFLDALPWRLLLVGVVLPVLAGHYMPRSAVDVDWLLEALLEYRLLVVALVVWVVLRLRLAWSMPVLVMTQFTFAAALARHLDIAGHRPELADVLGIAAECLVFELLALLLLLYSRDRENSANRHERESLTEPLTGLPNLTALRRQSALHGSPPVGFLLLDRTEKMSAGLGLRAQVALPCWAATLLCDLVDTYYIGEGQLVLVPIGAPAAPTTVAWEQVLRRLHDGQFRWMEQRVRVLPYIGVAGTELEGEPLDERIQRACDAAIEARDRGEMRVLPATLEGGDQHNVHRRSLQLSTTVLARIRAAEIELYFQPFLPLSARLPRDAVAGEVLCRLRNDGGRLMLPNEFLHELQADRRMAELDLAVVRHLDHWLREHRQGLPDIGRLYINIGSQSLASRVFSHDLLDLLDRFALSPERLCFEVTETAAMTHARESESLLAALRERGCHIAVDDFGVGYQSFERLKHVPLNVIKIDGSFVRDMGRSSRDLEIVRATVAVARAFEAETVAEWVEDPVTLDALRELGVDWAQGFHIARPAPIDTLLLRQTMAG
ncbi:MAG: EAL domain-containing protein [Dokdonella sp.]|uniref:EAL domain-containing protein n=1 Tax=Dokdonella sp. TaxID=2291710 RepID=UPI003264BCFE